MKDTLFAVLERFEQPDLRAADVIPWGSPVLSFGDPDRARIATLGLNPSNREFVDENGIELAPRMRRFHTLSSLGIRRWSDVATMHVNRILDSFRSYFRTNPYDRWFRVLDQLLSATSLSFYHPVRHACHLDLVPFATSRKWTELSSAQRAILLRTSGDTLGLLLRDSPIDVLVLNGRTVVETLQELTGVSFDAQQIPRWSLPRRRGAGVKGIAYKGWISRVGGVDLHRPVHVLGFNHNLQSSFGVTTAVKAEIREWLGNAWVEALS